MRAIVALLLATIAAAVLFVGWPGIDLAVSRALFLGERRFWLTDAPFALAVNAALPTVVLLTVAGILCAAVIGRVRRIPALAVRRMLFLVLSFAVGPGLIVNALLKEYWGRARPNDVAAFGGTARFTPALIPADQCAGNCSFVSGDVSIAFAYVAIALLLPARWRMAGIAGALSFGIFVAALRLLQGAHFLSDVVFAALFTLLPIAIFARWLLAPGDRA
jgi:lipid A 4'-phosphatase